MNRLLTSTGIMCNIYSNKVLNFFKIEWAKIKMKTGGLRAAQ